MLTKRCAALHAIDGSHHLDHIAVLAIGLDFPLLCVDEARCELAQRYYPGVKTELCTFREFAPDALAERFDCLFSCNFWGTVFREEFAFTQELYGKRMRSVYCPHGNSDKGTHYKWMEMFADEDIAFIYGERMIDFLREKGAYEAMAHPIISGNYRYPFYRQHRAFYQKIIQERVFSKLSQDKKTILYAPTWNIPETSLFSSHIPLFAQLPEDYQMIVKVHPTMEKSSLGLLVHLLGLYQDHPRILFLEHFPPVYPLLDNIDIYIGDASSIGYDCLAFRKPMFFLDEPLVVQKRGVPFFLHRCGTVIHDYAEIYKVIEATLPFDHQRFDKIREETYHYTFGKERSFQDIAQDLSQALQGSD